MPGLGTRSPLSGYAGDQLRSTCRKVRPRAAIHHSLIDLHSIMTGTVRGAALTTT